jgi:hypothetical protein
LSADHLAKTLYFYLIAADCHSSELRRLGWFDFIRYDLPETEDARVLAAIALHRLLVDDSGAQINHDDKVLYAVLAFTRSQRGGALPTTVSKELTIILSRSPVSESTLVEWFCNTFP